MSAQNWDVLFGYNQEETIGGRIWLSHKLYFSSELRANIKAAYPFIARNGLSLLLILLSPHLRHCPRRRGTGSLAWWRSPLRPSPGHIHIASLLTSETPGERSGQWCIGRGQSSWGGSPGWCSDARSSQLHTDTSRSYTDHAAHTCREDHDNKMSGMNNIHLTLGHSPCSDTDCLTSLADTHTWVSWGHYYGHHYQMSPHVLTLAMLPALQATLPHTAVSSTPAWVTQTPAWPRVEAAVTSTPGLAWPRCGVSLSTVSAKPAFSADTGALDTVAVSAAVWVWTVRVSAELSLVALHADTLAILTVTVSTAVRHLALLVPEVTQVSLFLPTLLNVTHLTLHSFPFHPGLQTHSPALYSPWPLHNSGQTLSSQLSPS